MLIASIVLGYFQSTTSAKADSTKKTINIINDLSKKATENSSTNNNANTCSAATKAIKKALKWAIKHIDDLVEGVGHVVGKDMAKKLAKHSNKVIKTLNKLLEYEDLAWQTVQDQVKNTLTPVVGYAAASTIALGVRLVLEFIAPI